MQKLKRSLSCLLKFPVAALITVLLCASFAWAGPGGRTIYSFPGGSNAANPDGSMIFDNGGSLYGVAGGGANNAGAVFKLTPSGTGSWTESVIYSFLNYSDYPGSNIVFDLGGNLYGTMPGSGSCGAVYQLVPSSGGSWTQNIIFSFNDSDTEGCYPESIIFDPATGDLYGITALGGASNSGTVFELIPVAGGGWNFSLVYSFLDDPSDGQVPSGVLTLDSSGNLYGTAVYGGSYNAGTVYKITNGADGWHESILYNFTGGFNGGAPEAGVIFDRLGNLYGTSYYNGGDEVGNVFKLTPTKGDWVIHVIHTFTGGPDGGQPSEFNLAIDGSGNLYGTTELGGLYNYGTAYKLSPSTGGKWKESVLHAFTNGADGGNPDCGFVFDSSGNLYGSTNNGGADGDGVVFEIKP
ncbi:MAG: choice-of-anchor tandem repeat GloVer-containing protein [Candidatus Sulfotelmatobacter sp.]